MRGHAPVLFHPAGGQTQWHVHLKPRLMLCFIHLQTWGISQSPTSNRFNTHSQLPCLDPPLRDLASYGWGGIPATVVCEKSPGDSSEHLTFLKSWPLPVVRPTSPNTWRKIRGNQGIRPVLALPPKALGTLENSWWFSQTSESRSERRKISPSLSSGRCLVISL